MPIECHAAYAYSIASKFAAGTTHAGDDFTFNATTAASAYGLISGVSSYYNNDPSYSYISGSNGVVYRLDGSKVFFINGHANVDHIVTGSRNTTEYRTGIGLGSNPTYYGTYKTVGINNRWLNPINVITYAGCLTGNGSGSIAYYSHNSRGAVSSVGFTTEVNTRNTYGPQWLSTYNYSLGYGYTVNDSITRAIIAYPSSNLLYVVVYGNANITAGAYNSYNINKVGLTNPLTINRIDDSKFNDVGTLATSSSIDQNLFKEVSTPINDLYLTIQNPSVNLNSISDDIVGKNLSDYESLFTGIIDKIKTNDDTFDISDYKVNYHIVNEESGYGIVTFTYFIDNKIETNKVYVATLKDYKVLSIVLGGVKKSNIQNVSSFNLNDINYKIEKFNNNKANLLIERIGVNNLKSTSILNSNNEVNISSLNSNVIKSNEKYFYDFNTSTLIYKLSTTSYFNEDDVYDVYSYDIEL